MPGTLSIDIPAIPAPHSAPAAPSSAWARRLILTSWRTVKLLISELITNSVKYGGEGALTLNVEAATQRHVRVEVVDQGVGFVPVARDRPVTDAGGWGLHLVQTLTNRWGVHEGSTHVWFEIDREGPAEPHAVGAR
jgi:anti-sigma regulatory factor (Ser/Thr protein kinase)